SGLGCKARKLAARDGKLAEIEIARERHFALRFILAAPGFALRRALHESAGLHQYQFKLHAVSEVDRVALGGDERASNGEEKAECGGSSATHSGTPSCEWKGKDRPMAEARQWVPGRVMSD